MRSTTKCSFTPAFVVCLVVGLPLLFPSGAFAQSQEEESYSYWYAINRVLDMAFLRDPELREEAIDQCLNDLAGPSAETLRILMWYNETETWLQRKLLFQIFDWSPMPLEEMKTLLIENMPAFRKGEIEQRIKMINRMLDETPEEYFHPSPPTIAEPPAAPSKFIQLIPPEYLLIEHEKKNAAIKQSGAHYASTVRKLLWIMEKDSAMQRLLLEQTIATDEETRSEYVLEEMLTIAARFTGEEEAKRSAMLREVWATIGTTVDADWKPPLSDFADSETKAPPKGGEEIVVAQASTFPWVILVIVGVAAFSGGAISTFLFTRAKKTAK